jgi:hypothetical protein
MKKALLILAALLLPVGLVLLSSVHPDEAEFYPKCIFYLVTGLHCPGCGTARALYSLLNGQFAQAAAYNILLIVILPFLIYWAARKAYFLWHGRPATSRPMPTWAARGIAIVFVAYWVFRNIPIEPFSLLAPHQL